jgi:hypothetical protein
MLSSQMTGGFFDLQALVAHHSNFKIIPGAFAGTNLPGPAFFLPTRCVCDDPNFGMRLQNAIAWVFTLLAPVLLATVCAESPLVIKFLPDGPPYSLLDLPVLSATPPFPRSIEILDMQPSEKIHFNSGNLFIKVSDNGSPWAHAQVTYQVRDLLPGRLLN